MTGQKLKELREKHSLTQQDVADGIGAGRTRISEWENEKYTISKAYVALLSLYFSKL